MTGTPRLTADAERLLQRVQDAGGLGAQVVV